MDGINPERPKFQEEAKPPPYDAACNAPSASAPGYPGYQGVGSASYSPPPAYFVPPDPSQPLLGPNQPAYGPQVTTVIIGGCPICGVGILQDDFTFLGLLFAILFFPLGIICCLALRQKRCRNCGAVFA